MTTVLLSTLVGLSAITIILLFIVISKSSNKKINTMEKLIRDEFRLNRMESSNEYKALREELSNSQKRSTGELIKTINELGNSQKNYLELVERRIKDLTASNENKVEKIRETVEAKMNSLQEGNEKKLDQMRQVVEEKLQITLEKRLTESFKVINDQLQKVQMGLGKMQTLANSVGDLKKVLTNVKTRGTWGEVQLGNILQDILSPNQYDSQVQVKEGSSEKVDYAILLPGKNDYTDSKVMLPIDSKFPQEDYLRLVQASEDGDIEKIKDAQKGLINAVKKSAKSISEKYLNPPKTTDFAIMFLPTEGLYAEILREGKLVETLQRDYRVVIAGPTTLTAILNSLQMGFQTLAIEKQSSEVWKVLAAVKTEFGKFSDVLIKVKKQLETASKTLDSTAVRTRAMERKLKDVESLPENLSEDVLGLPKNNKETL